MMMSLICVWIGGHCSVIPTNKRKPQDPCAGRRCGEPCEAPSGKAVSFCQPDGSCGTDTSPACEESTRQDPWLQIAEVVKETLMKIN